MTGTIEASIVRVSKGEIRKSKTIVPNMNMKDLTNIETLVLSPS